MDISRLQTLKSLLMSELDVAVGRIDKVVGQESYQVLEGTANQQGNLQN